MGKLCILISVLWLLPVAHAQEPPERTRALVEALMAARKPTPAAFAAVDAFFDYDRICSDSIKAHRAKLTDKQYAEFAANFRVLLRLKGYPDSGKFFAAAKRTVRGKGTDVTVETVLEEDDVEVEITFRWARAGGSWRVYDLLFDGDSLTGDYQNQFGRLIAKRGAEGLLKRLRERLDRETRERGKVD